MAKSIKKKKSTWGGKRAGAGGKFKDPEVRKHTVILYVMKKDIDRMGGSCAFKDKCYGLLK